MGDAPLTAEELWPGKETEQLLFQNKGPDACTIHAPGDGRGLTLQFIGEYRPAVDWEPQQTKEEQSMNILQQCQKWHENNEYQKIIDALEAIPTQERTPEMDSELARAYNNLADPYKPGGKNMLKKAIALLKPHEEYFQGDHCWNFRMGYSYYYLDQEGRALR